MPISPQEILETIRMIRMEHLDIRTVTMGISLLDIRGDSIPLIAESIYDKIVEKARNLREAVEEVSSKYDIPIANTRLTVTPIAIVARAKEDEDLFPIGEALDKAGEAVRVDYIGGFGALVHKDCTPSDLALINSIPKVLANLNRVCSSVNVASTKSGINMDAVLMMAEKIKETAELSADRDSVACAKLVVYCNAPEDNPFMAGGFHGVGEGESAINIAISGPGTVRAALERLPNATFAELTEEIKRITFKITRVGELIGREISQKLGIPFGIVDLSLAPTPEEGDSIADILRAMGLEECGAPGSLAAIALLTDAVKKGGLFASSSVGGLSGTFIPVTEDAGMARAVARGSLSLDKLQAMTAVCSVGLDMVAIPGDTPVETIAGIIADQMAIGMINNKTVGVRIIPAIGKKAGEWIEFGGLLGKAPVLDVSSFRCDQFVKRKGRIQAPLTSFTN
ncbi:PFL family protein [bacterium]|nr:PFL family protein [bacterium]